MSVLFRFTLSPPSRDHMTAILFYLFAGVLGSCWGFNGRIVGKSLSIARKSATIKLHTAATSDSLLIM